MSTHEPVHLDVTSAVTFENVQLRAENEGLKAQLAEKEAQIKAIHDALMKVTTTARQDTGAIRLEAQVIISRVVIEASRNESRLVAAAATDLMKLFYDEVVATLKSKKTHPDDWRMPVTQKLKRLVGAKVDLVMYDEAPEGGPR